MYYFLAVILPVAAGVLLALLLRLKVALPQSNRIISFVGAVLLLVGAALSLHSVSVFRMWHERSKWPPVEATVVESTIVGPRVNDPLIGYTYTVNGVNYDGTTKLGAPGFGGKNKRLEVAEELTHEHPVGSVLTVYYNPTDPAVSIPTIHPPWNAYLHLAVGVMATIGAACSVCLILLPRRSSVATITR